MPEIEIRLEKGRRLTDLMQVVRLLNPPLHLTCLNTGLVAGIVAAEAAEAAGNHGLVVVNSSLVMSASLLLLLLPLLVQR